MDWAAFRRSKAYDLLMAAPLILWFGWNALAARPALMGLSFALMDRPRATTALALTAVVVAILFDLLLVWSLLARAPVVRRATGLLPRLCAVAGTFIGVGILGLPVAPLSLPMQVLATGLLLLGGAGSFLSLLWLGRGFSIVPEARLLVTSGPYAWARHPLYAMECVTLTGMALQYRQPWAGLLVLAALILIGLRSVFEERALAEAFPAYDDYRRRTRRFLPGLF